MSVLVKSSRCQTGTSLLEVLIAVVILSIGLLGLAGLQVAGLRVNQGAMQRSQATMLAYDVLDRMRSDRDFVSASNYGSTDLPAKYDAVKTVEGRSVPLDLGELNGHVEQTVRDWAAAMNTSLTAPEGMICRTANPDSGECTGSGSYMIVLIRWADENNRNTSKQSIWVVGQL